jgi:hypothetical protein
MGGISFMGRRGFLPPLSLQVCRLGKGGHVPSLNREMYSRSISKSTSQMKPSSLEDRVVDACPLKSSSSGKLAKTILPGWILRADTGELPQLGEAEVGLDRALKGLDQLGDLRDDIRAGQFVTQGTQDAVLIVCAGKGALDADARQGECARPVQVNEVCLLRIAGAYSYLPRSGRRPVRAGTRLCRHGVDDLFERPHVDCGIVIDVVPKFSVSVRASKPGP